MTTDKWLNALRWLALGAVFSLLPISGGPDRLVASALPAGSVFVPISPQRILDTRSNLGLTGPFASNVPRVVTVSGSVSTANGTMVVVPQGSTGVTLNVTVVGPSADGFLSVRPAGSAGAPSTSNLNFVAKSTTPNAVTVALPANGAVEVFFDAYGKTGPTTDVLIDVMGYFEQSAGGAQGPTGPAGPTGATGPRGPSNGYWTHTYGNATTINNGSWTTIKSFSLPAGNYIVTANLSITMVDSFAGSRSFIQVNCLMESSSAPGASQFSIVQSNPASGTYYTNANSLTVGFSSTNSFAVDLKCQTASSETLTMFAFVSNYGITAIRVETLTEM